MKKIIVSALALLLCLGFMAGCDDIEDMADITVEATETEAFPVGSIGSSVSSYGVNVDLTDNSDYDDYSELVKKIEIERFDYRVVQNVGGGGSFKLYFTPLDPTLADLDYIDTTVPTDASELTGDITFAAGTTTLDWTNVTILNKGEFENLFFHERKFTLWAEISPATGATVTAVEIVARIKIKITANFFEKI